MGKDNTSNLAFSRYLRTKLFSLTHEFDSQVVCYTSQQVREGKKEEKKRLEKVPYENQCL